MPRKGPRPHIWKVKGERGHDQHIAWMRMKAQANFRGEEFDLTFEDFQLLWDEHWEERGRKSYEYCLTRADSTEPWNATNTICVQRLEYLTRR